MIAAYPKDKDGNKLVSVPYYRVGDLFLTTIATNPSSYLGGKWELFGPGRCLVCVDTSQSEFNSVKKTGGEKEVTLTVDQIPPHNHQAAVSSINGSAEAIIRGTSKAIWRSLISSTGGGQPHNNLQPFITCYVWIRTA